MSWKLLSLLLWGLSLFPILTPPTPTPPKTKHTCKLLAVEQGQAGEFHALEHLDVAWGNGIGGENEEGSWKGSSDEALGPQPVSNLDPTYHTPPKTKHTCELVALVQVQAGERHVLEHLDVAWGNGVGEGRVLGGV
jgi:hypothetical protein